MRYNYLDNDNDYYHFPQDQVTTVSKVKNHKEQKGNKENLEVKLFLVIGDRLNHRLD